MFSKKLFNNNQGSSSGGGGQSSPISASNVTYINGNIKNVKQALDTLLYVEPKITSFIGGGNYEIGTTVADVNLTWTINKNVTSQVLEKAGASVGDIDVSARTYTDTEANLSTNTTYKLTVSDGIKSTTAITTISFKHKRYYGVSTNDTLDNAGILGLSNELTDNRIQTRTFDCSGGKYFYFVLPKSMCTGISFKVGGLTFSDMTVIEVGFTNASGYTSTYNIYRSTEFQTGSAITVEVK